MKLPTFIWISLYVLLFLAPNAYCVETLDLGTLDPKVWTETVEKFQPTQHVIIEKAEFEIISKPIKTTGSVIFLVRRIDQSRHHDTILKIRRFPEENLPGDPYSLKLESQNLEVQSHIMRAPRVYFLSSNYLVMEKEYIDGPTFREWVDHLKLNDTLENSLSNVVKIFATKRLIETMNRKGITFGDAVASNLAFEKKTDQLVVFDGRNLIRGVPGINAGFYMLTRAIENNRDADILWIVAGYYRGKFGHTDEAQSATFKLIRVLGDSPTSLYESLYKLNSFHSDYPAEFKHIVGAFVSQINRRATENSLNPQNPGLKFFQTELEQSFFQDNLTRDQKLKLAKHIMDSGLPGNQYGRQLKFRIYGKQSPMARLSRFCGEAVKKLLAQSTD